MKGLFKKLTQVSTVNFFKNLKPLGGGWDLILLILDINIFCSLSLCTWR